MLKSFVIFSLLGVSLAGNAGYPYLPGGPRSVQVSAPVSHFSTAPVAQAPVTHLSIPHFAAPVAQAPTYTVSAPAHTSAPVSAPAVKQNIEKHFYYFSAPEEKHEQHPALKKALETSVKRNLQVIFIKTPEDKGLERAVQNYVRQAVEQKTHIYVLSKEPDYAGLAKRVQQVQQAQSTQSRPEVHFVKYHTPADAKHAQQQITQQYEALGGTSAHFDGGVAHVRSINGGKREVVAPARNDVPVDKSYANNFLPSGVDVVPGSSYIPLATLRN